MKKFLATLIAATVLFTGVANAANFDVYTNGDNYTYVDVTGKIMLTDGLRFRELAKKLKGKDVVVNLDSSGGNVLGGLGIAVTVRDNGWRTYVGSEITCASMCADIWLAGETRYASKTSYIGMHSAGLEDQAWGGAGRRNQQPADQVLPSPSGWTVRPSSRCLRRIPRRCCG